MFRLCAGHDVLPRLVFSEKGLCTSCQLEFVDINYTGVGSDQALDTIYYAFTDPENVSHKQYTFNAALEYQPFKAWTWGLNYMYDNYKIKDWMQTPEGGWVDPVTENYWRDSTQDNRWGNRLVSLGSYLGPSYENHVFYVTAKYKWQGKRFMKLCSAAFKEKNFDNT